MSAKYSKNAFTIVVKYVFAIIWTCSNFLNVLLLEANHVVELGEEDRVEMYLFILSDFIY